METTLGARIVAHRKKAGMTQDKLAYLLGVTAQAVSKWENDQSCPDIAMLPKLAELFGTTTDELLGVTQKEAQQEEAPPAEPLETGVSAEWQWEPGKPTAFAFAFSVLLVGILTLVSRLLNWDVSFWDILWPGAILFVGLNGLIRKISVFDLGCILLGVYCMLNNLHLLPFQISGNLVLPIIILIFGTMLLLEAFKKPAARHFSFHRDTKTKQLFQIDGEQFTGKFSFGESKRCITMPRLSKGDIACSFGEYTFDLRGCESFSDHCRLDVKCSFSDVNLLIPKHIKVKMDSSTALGDVEVTGSPDPVTTDIIHLTAKVSFGNLTITYV